MSSSTSEATSLVDVVMPQMGVSVSEGTIVTWRATVGDRIEYEAPIVDISTDKIDTELPAPAAGVVAEVLVEEGTTVSVGTLLARIQPEGGAAGGGNAEVGAASEAAAAQGETPAPATASPAPAPGVAAEGQVRRYSPVVQRIAAEHGLDLDGVEGTGRGGRVTKKDVLRAVHGREGDGDGGADPPLHIESPYRPDAEPSRAAAPARPGPGDAPGPRDDLGGVTAPLSRMRRLIGGHMLDSLRTAATCTTVTECDMSAVERARAQLGVTYLPIVARATIDALREHPQLNATLEDDQLTTYPDRVHLGIAVSLGAGGLIVPVVRDAQDLAVEGLAKRIKELARRAREGALTPDDVTGATFTITNPGPFGSVLATPVINQPQVAILDTEAVVKRPVVVTDADGDDSIAIRPMTFLCMSWDHRALDGALAAQFLGSVRRRLEAWQ